MMNSCLVFDSAVLIGPAVTGQVPNSGQIVSCGRFRYTNLS